jgi:hypothetical protein
VEQQATALIDKSGFCSPNLHWGFSVSESIDFQLKVCSRRQSAIQVVAMGATIIQTSTRAAFVVHQARRLVQQSLQSALHIECWLSFQQDLASLCNHDCDPEDARAIHVGSVEVVFVDDARGWRAHVLEIVTVFCPRQC